MGWTSYYVGNKNVKECTLEEVKHYENHGHSIKKMARQGKAFYFLMTDKEKGDWVLCMLTQKRNGEYFYKDIQCNPYESGVPLSILKSFVPGNKEDKIWLEKSIKEAEEKQRKAVKVNIGDYLKCSADFSIWWGSSAHVEPGSDFIVHCVKSGHSTKNTKQYLLARKNDYNGEWYDTPYKIRNSTFKCLKVEKI